jgi:hypothetical protein
MSLVFWSALRLWARLLWKATLMQQSPVSSVSSVCRHEVFSVGAVLLGSLNAKIPAAEATGTDAPIP